MRGVGTLRELLDSPEPVVAPGAYDALSARLVEQAGYPAVYMTGFGASASLLGRPDVGLLSFGEMVDQARRLVQAVGVPVIADADDGYGNHLNVARTVREYEAAGVAALHIEDQVAPKRCGHMAGKAVIPQAEMVEKVRAAVDARQHDVLLVARTDARAVNGLDDALNRARAYKQAGADVLFVEAPETEREVEAVAAAFPDTPLVFNAVDGGRTPAMPLERLRELGFSLVLRPVATLFAAARAVQDVLRDGRPSLGFDEFTDLVGLPELQELERRLTDPDAGAF